MMAVKEKTPWLGSLKQVFSGVGSKSINPNQQKMLHRQDFEKLADEQENILRAALPSEVKFFWERSLSYSAIFPKASLGKFDSESLLLCCTSLGLNKVLRHLNEYKSSSFQKPLKHAELEIIHGSINAQLRSVLKDMAVYVNPPLTTNISYLEMVELNVSLLTLIESICDFCFDDAVSSLAKDCIVRFEEIDWKVNSAATA